MATVTIQGIAYEVYDTYDNVDQYLRSVPSGADWRAALETEQQYAMIGATRVFDRQRWTGTKTSAGQALEFPRDGLKDKSGVAVADGSTPQEILDGFAEYTRLLLSDIALSDSSSSGKNIRSVSAGSASVTFFSSTISGNNRAPKFPTAVHELIAPFLSGSGSASALGIVVTGTLEPSESDYGYSGNGLT